MGRRDQCRRLYRQDSLSARLRTLRSGDIRRWSRLMRPARPPHLGYVPSAVTLPDGAVARPRDKAEVFVGAVQEWIRLFHEPSSPWSSPYVDSWMDGAGVLRGCPAFQCISTLDLPTLSGRLGAATCTLALGFRRAGRESSFASGMSFVFRWAAGSSAGEPRGFRPGGPLQCQRKLGLLSACLGGPRPLARLIGGSSSRRGICCSDG